MLIIANLYRLATNFSAFVVIVGKMLYTNKKWKGAYYGKARGYF
jgi:hypothetical protein